MDNVGELVRPRELRIVVYKGGVEPALRKVVWKHLLGVYPQGKITDRINREAATTENMVELCENIW